MIWLFKLVSQPFVEPVVPDTLVNLWLLSVSCCPQSLAIGSNALMTEKSIDMKIRFGPTSLHRHNQYLSWSPNGNISYYFYELDLFQHQILCISALIKCTHLVWLCPFVYDFYFRYNFKTSLFYRANVTAADYCCLIFTAFSKNFALFFIYLTTLARSKCSSSVIKGQAMFLNYTPKSFPSLICWVLTYAPTSS